MIPVGMTACAACSGCGYTWPPPPLAAWLRCHRCDGLGHVWRAGGPGFGCTLELGDREPGELVELATGDRARVLWHIPKKTPDVTFVALIDAFDDTESDSPTPVDAHMGIASVTRGAARTKRDDHAGDKDSDAVDPLATRARALEGPLL